MDMSGKDGFKGSETTELFAKSALTGMFWDEEVDGE